MIEDTIDLAVQLTPAQVKNYTEPTARIGGIHVSIKTARSGMTEYNHGTIHVKRYDPLEECVKRGIFDDNHLWAARSIQTLFEVAFRTTNLRVFSLSDAQGGEYKFSIEPVIMYSRLMRGLLPWQAHLVRRIALSEVRQVDIGDFTGEGMVIRQGWIYHNRHRVQESFEALMNLLEKICESAKVENTTKPEVSLK